MKSDALIILPLFILVVTGFIYTNYQASQTNCLGAYGCTTTPTGDVDTSSPLFNLMTGNYAGLFASLAAVTFGSTSYQFNVPSLAITNTYDLMLPRFWMPTLTFQWASVGGQSFGVPNFLGGTFYINIPVISIPSLTLDTYFVNLGDLSIPLIGLQAYTVNLPSPTYAAISLLIGGIMLFLGLGIGVTLLGSGYSINTQGSRTLTVMGTGIVLWTFISLFTGDWILTLPYSWGPMLMGFLELAFIIGIYLRIPLGGE